VSRFHSYLNSASSILHAYKGEQPFSIFLKSYFGQYKKFGSKDRKQVSHLCYSYFRLGQALQHLPTEERILAGLFLCEQHPNELMEAVKPEWNELIALPPDQKATILKFFIEDIFPWRGELSQGIDSKSFASSFLIQPDLFLRLRPGKEGVVKQKLHRANISFNEINPACLSLENAVQADQAIELDKEALVQDYNSQRVSEFLDFARNSFLLLRLPTGSCGRSGPLSVYDCCAGSGGKSILAYDILENIHLTVSDIRESIISNLKKRFERAGIRNYTALVEDLSSNNKPKTENRKPPSFDLVICDAPCTGSGTWSRTPEQLYYFQTERIGYYSNLQKNILENVVPLLKEGGNLLYITCSVFKKENEEVVDFLEKEFKLRNEKSELLKGYDKKADTLFAALLRK
jgi:16S rRNA (cytosine967-C5)-methyltransferase